MKPFNLFVHESDLCAAIVALEDAGRRGIASRWREQLESERKVQRTAAEAEASLADMRKERAANHVLTESQAHALAAIRAGQSPYHKWRPYSEPVSMGEGRVRYGRWDRSRSMGGAVRRMIETLRDEGLIDPKRWTLLPAGLARLEAWELKHKKFLGEKANA